MHFLREKKYYDFSKTIDEVLAKNGQTILHLDYSNNIDIIQEALEKTPGLQGISLTHCRLDEIPSTIFRFKNLRYLNVSGNLISVIPDKIGELPKLEFLMFGEYNSMEEGSDSTIGNYIQKIPKTIGKLKRLIQLDLSDNQITNLPEELWTLTSLEELNLTRNKLTELPPGIRHLINLRTLNISYNQINKLSPEIMDLKNLTFFFAYQNPLEPNFPSIYSISEGFPTALEVYFKWNPPPSDIFINYSRLDQIVVEKIYQLLIKSGHRPWMDVHSLKGGEIWIDAIYDAIDKCNLFIAILSNNSVDKRGTIQRELKAALDKWEEMLPGDIYLIPVRLDACPIPTRLKDFHVLDWNNGKGSKKLLEAIKVGIERKK